MAPVVHGLEAKYCGQIEFSYLDIDDPANQLFKDALNFNYQPHLVLLDAEGEIITQWVGFANGEQLESAFLDALGQ